MSYGLLLALAWLSLTGGFFLTALAGYAGQMTLVSYIDDPAMKYLAAPEHAFFMRCASLAVTLLSLGLFVAAHVRAAGKWPFWTMRNKAEDASLAQALRRGDWGFIGGRMKVALIRDPQDKAAMANLGLALWGLERKEEARQALEKAVELGLGGKVSLALEALAAGRSPRVLVGRPKAALISGALGIPLLFAAGGIGHGLGYLHRELGLTHYDSSEFSFMFTPHYKINFHDNLLAQNLSSQVEDISAVILDDLGCQVSEMPEGNIQIFLCNTEDEYRERNRLAVAGWAGGHAIWQSRTLFVFPSEDLMIDTLPHELTHILLGGFTHCSESWIQEGVATYIGLLFRFNHDHERMPLALDRVHLFEKLKGGAHFHVSDLLTLNPQTLEDTNRVDVFYIQAFSMIYFLREKYGAEKFHNMIHLLKSTGSPKAALTSAYREEFKDFDDLEGTWLVYFTL